MLKKKSTMDEGPDQCSVSFLLHFVLHFSACYAVAQKKSHRLTGLKMNGL